MKAAIFYIVICSVLAVCFAAVSRGIYKDPKNPGKCTIRPDLILSPGEHQNPDGCGRIYCDSDGSAVFHTCGVEAPPPGYVLGNAKNPKADYPKCCEREFVKKD